MLVSIVTVVRKDPDGLAQTIDALGRQSYRDFEHVIINGGDDAETQRVCDQHRAPLRKVLTEADRGISDAFNKACRLVSGDLILHLNAGDVLAHENVLQEVVAQIANDEGRRRKIYFGDYIYSGKSMNRLVKTSVEGLTTTNSLNHQSVFVGADLQAEYPYDLRMRLTMDYDVWLRCRAAGEIFVKLDGVVAVFREGGVSSQYRHLMANIFSREACRFLNIYTRYTWMDFTRFYARATLQILRARLKEFLGGRVLDLYRKLKFR